MRRAVTAAKGWALKAPLSESISIGDLAMPGGRRIAAKAKETVRSYLDTPLTRTIFENGDIGWSRSDSTTIAVRYFDSALMFEQPAKSARSLFTSAGSTSAQTWVEHALKGDPESFAQIPTTGDLWGDTLSGDDLMNGIELLCDVNAEASPLITAATPPTIQSVEDLAKVSEFMRQLATRIKEHASLSVFANVPKAALDAMREQSSSGAYPKFGGAMGEQLSRLRGGLLRLRETGPLLAGEIAQFSADLDQLRIRLQKSEVSQNITKLQFTASMTQQLANCASAAVDTAKNVLSFGVGTAITCANAVAQINFAAGIAELQGRMAELDSDLAIADFGGRFASRSTNLQSLALRMGEAQEDFDASLATIDSLRDQAIGSIARAVHFLSFQAEHEAQVTNVHGNLFSGKQLRYNEALANAKRMSFLAKRAIEQRLGVRLSEMASDLPLVQAPQKWESKICTFSGLDFESLKLASPNADLDSFTGGFISDYVAKLENVVESYRLEHNFHEGADTAIVSLRDDLLNVRRKCDVPTENLLYQAGQLDGASSPGWHLEGCLPSDADGVPPSDCVRMTSLDNDGPPFAQPELAKVNGYELTFGPGGTPSAAVVQDVTLEAGRYRLTWYTKEGFSGTANAYVGGAAADLIQSAVPLPVVEIQHGFASAGNWNRESRVMTLERSGSVKVGFGVPRGAAPHTTIAAPMLERLPVRNQSYAATPFINTGDSLSRPQPVCEDTDGEAFRSTQWTRRCLRLCADGFSNDCSAERAQAHCFYETSFSFDQRSIQLGKVLNFSGFARGNFNYRIDRIGLNFVGTGTRNCVDSQSGSTCYAAGYIPYSIEHNGPFYVRNHEGADVESLIFDGRIEHARGLASERYLSNPLSSADEALTAQYLRSELRGRPLDGNFVIRVWDEPGVDFNAIRDIQIELKYRYWTRFE